MSILAKFKNSKKNTKIIALALVMAVVAGGLAFATTHNSKQAAKSNAAKKASTGTHTITTKSGKKITVPNVNQTADQRAKLSDDRFQKRIDSAVKQKRITDAQAKLIKDKAAQQAKVNLTKLDPKARAAAQKDLYTWAKDNKIPLSFVFEMSRPRA